MGIFEFLYYIGYSAKKYYSLKNRKKLPFKVISIGNITTGGTGKTPATIAIAGEAKRRGFNPVILTRGYKGKAKGPCFVGYQQSAVSYQLFGDEPVLMASKLKDVPIVKCADRFKGGMFALQSLIPNPQSPPLFILDDGFQHRQLFRDRDILLIDAGNPFDNRKLLPVGLLREPLEEMKRADIIVITKTEVGSQKTEAGSLIEEIKKYNSESPVFLAEHKPTGFIKSSGESMPLKWAEGKNLFAFCGIGSPESFRETILSSGGSLKGVKTYRDHYAYKQADIEEIIGEARESGAGWIVTTEKDIMKIRKLRIPDNLVSVAIEFAADEKFFDEVFKEI